LFESALKTSNQINIMRNKLTGILLLFTLLSINLAASTMSAAANADRFTVAGKVLANIDQATWFSEGKSPHVIYVFFDPNCPYCHRIYTQTRDQVKQNAIQIRWVPLGILATTSHGKAISILDAQNPLKAFYENEDGYSASDGGAIDEALDGTDKAKRALDRNADLLKMAGFDSVPSILFRANNGQAILIHGAPPADRFKKILRYVQ
jgi:thiol:disulfide interchange protein DsbG